MKVSLNSFPPTSCAMISTQFGIVFYIFIIKVEPFAASFSILRMPCVWFFIWGIKFYPHYIWFLNRTVITYQFMHSLHNILHIMYIFGEHNNEYFNIKVKFYIHYVRNTCNRSLWLLGNEPTSCQERYDKLQLNVAYLKYIWKP